MHCGPTVFVGIFICNSTLSLLNWGLTLLRMSHLRFTSFRFSWLNYCNTHTFFSYTILLHSYTEATESCQVFQAKPVKVKVKWSRYRPGVAQRVCRDIALLFHDHGTRRGWVVSSTPRPHFTPGKDPVPIVQEAGWAPWSVWTGGKSRLHRDSIPDRPARSSVAIPTELPGPLLSLLLAVKY